MRMSRAIARIDCNTQAIASRYAPSEEQPRVPDDQIIEPAGHDAPHASPPGRQDSVYPADLADGDNALREMESIIGILVSVPDPKI